MERSLIEKFANKVDKTKVQEFYITALSIVTSALDEICENAEYKELFTPETTRIFPMGDYTNETFIDESGELEIVIASHNSQLIFNNSSFLKNLSKAKSKKQRENISNIGTLDKFSIDFSNILATHFNPTTFILLNNDGIKILCLQEYGFKILIRLATFNDLDDKALLNFWVPLQKKIRPIDLFTYNENMEQKDARTKGNYKKLIRIFKNIRKTILVNKWAMGSDLNKYFIELIVYNIPDSLMLDKNIVECFCKSVNFLENCDVLSFVSFDGNALNTFSFAKLTYSRVLNYIHYMTKLL